MRQDRSVWIVAFVNSMSVLSLWHLKWTMRRWPPLLVLVCMLCVMKNVPLRLRLGLPQQQDPAVLLVQEIAEEVVVPVRDQAVVPVPLEEGIN